jgi:altronate hydrolase
MEAIALRVHPADDVAVLLSPALAKGTRIRIDDADFFTDGAIGMGHKIALRPLEVGHLVMKYGQPFGRVTRDIAPGAHVHTHNVETMLGKNEAYSYAPYAPKPLNLPSAPTFRGYVRTDEKVGVRNEVWVLCTVGCINKLAEEVARRGHEKYKNVLPDGIFAHIHPYGCAQIGHDLAQTRKALAALAAHPNCGGVLLLGLGCENNILMEQVEAFRGVDAKRVRYFAAQEVEDEIDHAVNLLGELVEIAKTDTRTEVPLSKLVLGMKCGGSDGFSGLTANPLVGVLADRLAAWGGTSVLTEVPEMFGAEKLLMERADSETTFGAIESMINDFKDYFRRYDEPISENPAPGNKAGGITTLEEKSLGCIQKGGSNAPITHVLGYGEPLPTDTKTGGVVLAYGPGNDGVSCTTLAASGAQIVLFTTGRGTPFGTCVPTMKISTNTELATKKPHWIDFDAGRLVSEGLSLEALASELMQQVIRIASGETLTCSERNSYREIVLFKDGVTN